MSKWNFNMDQAPRGNVRVERRTIGKNAVEVERHTPSPIIAAGACGVVTPSYWLPASGRWNMFTKDRPPIAWMPWPTHPAQEAAE
jgi:hypothetical protein